MVQSIGSFASGIEMSDAIRGEFRHRYNRRTSEKRRDGFPLTGHYDTWLIDLLQILVERNHNVLIYPTWTNTADFANTPEAPGGTIALQSSELTVAVNKLLSPLNGVSRTICIVKV